GPRRAGADGAGAGPEARRPHPTRQHSRGLPGGRGAVGMNKLTPKQMLVLGVAGFAVLYVTALGFVGGAASAQASFRALIRKDAPFKAEVTNLDNNKFNITASVRVTDSAGGVLGGLDRRDFEVFEDGKLVDVKSFVSAGQQSLRVCMVIDQSGSMRDSSEGGGSKMAGAIDAAKTLVGIMRDGEDQ